MAEVKPNLQEAVETARTVFAVDSPVINFIIGLLIAYIVIYFITFYLGPVLFGLRPYRPFPIFARTLHHVTRRAADFLNDEPGMDLSEKVSKAIQELD